MINIAICDDNKYICSQIETILLDYAQVEPIKLNIHIFYTGESLLDYIRQNNTFHIIYLDIELGQMNGVEVGKYIRQTMKDYKTEIIYISGNDSYDRQLFDVQPLHFIPKPIQKSTVIDDLNLALEHLNISEHYYTYQKGHDMYNIPISEILYFESRKREIVIVTTTSEDTFYENLDVIAKELLDYQFFQIHRSYLMNYKHAKIIRYTEVVMSNNVVLPIGKTKRSAFRKMQINLN
jgi:DNA-binding LytR/AlgR family response regulator